MVIDVKNSPLGSSVPLVHSFAQNVGSSFGIKQQLFLQDMLSKDQVLPG